MEGINKLQYHLVTFIRGLLDFVTALSFSFPLSPISLLSLLSPFLSLSPYFCLFGKNKGRFNYFGVCYPDFCALVGLSCT